MERISSSGSTKRPSSIHSGSGYMPTSPVSSLPPPSLLHDDVFSNNPEDYDIRLPIGYGSSAVVYNAYYKPLNRRVAIKVIDLDMFERNQIDELRRETQVMALCKHPNVLRVNGAFVTDSKLYIVTPYLSAGSCLDIMKTAYPEGFDEISIATILKQALQGLDYLHKNGHIHRDVKAGNLLVDDDGSVLLGDFGVSSSLMENGDRRGQRKTFVGTPCWMAPEVMEQAGYDYKADIWSFGITAIELATGHAPFAKYPPIKVLMLTLSNDPPTLDRESTKHRYSKLLKEMIDCCLQKDASRRPSAEKLLNHSFFKQAKKKSHLVTGLLHNLPPLEQRPPKKAPPKANIPEKGVSWDFGAEDTPDEPVRRPRTVTFERPDRPVSTATTESTVAGTPILESRSLDSMPEDDSQQQIGTPASSHSGDKPVKKSRFVVEDSSSAVSSPPTSNYGAESHLSPSGMASPSLSHTVVSPVPVPASQNLHGLGVSSNGAEPIGTPEVRKGRFSVKDTTLNISSPTPISMKTAGSESLMSPSRSLSSSPVEGVPDGVHIGAPLELGPSERKSRFEVHHSHAGALTPTNGTGLNSPVLSATQILSREPSQSRVAGDLGLSRESSATRVSRFSVEPSQSLQETGPSSAAASAFGTPNASQSKRSRFQVSNVEGRPGDTATDVAGSAHSTPNTSPSASLLRGQVDIMEGQGTPAVYAHLETLYRQNEQQRVILTELFAGLGLKAGSSISSTTKSQLSHIEVQSTSVAPSNASSGQGQVSMERQLQSTIRENESLRRENEALKRELDRLRRGGL
ncbi:kinase-like domain-containing protein [Linnemannia elongata]|nr:kinase-like domain-containing protein [Linnemannia elongata]